MFFCVDDLSSIDGSDNEEEDVAAPVSGGVQQVERLLEKLSTSTQQEQQSSLEQSRLSSAQKFEKSPKIFFKNGKGQILTCYKTIWLHEVEKQVHNTNFLASY